MKKIILFLILLTVLLIPTFAMDFGVNYTKELGGYKRVFYGLTFRSVGEGFIGFDLQLITPSLTDFEDPMKNLEYLLNHYQDIEYAQLLPFILVNLPTGPLTLYVGAAPMIDILYPKAPEDEERQFNVQLFSPYMFYAKAGAQLNLLFLGAYVEVGTILDLTFKSTFEVFHITGGAVLNF